MGIEQLDLNLLRVFDALAVEGHVTRAARRLGLSQSALSHALGRLRAALGDDLFVRGAGRMVLTSHAARMAQPVRQALASLEDAVREHTRFDAGTTSRAFHLGVSDYAELVIIPRLVALLLARAPRVTLIALAIGDQAQRQLETGGLDLMIDTRGYDGPDVHARALLRDDFVCLVRSGHPRARRRLSLERYLELPHLLISQQGHRVGVVDRRLAELGLTRHIACTVPHFLAAPHVIAGSDLILTVGRRVATVYTPALKLQMLPPPLTLPDLGVRMIWHHRTHRDEAQRWLRAMVAEAADAGISTGS